MQYTIDIYQKIIANNNKMRQSHSYDFFRGGGGGCTHAALDAEN